MAEGRRQVRREIKRAINCQLMSCVGRRRASRIRPDANFIGGRML